MTARRFLLARCHTPRTPNPLSPIRGGEGISVEQSAEKAALRSCQSLAMQAEASGVDMVHGRRSLIRLVELPCLPDKAFLPRLRVLMPIRERARLRERNRRDRLNEHWRD